MANWYDYNSVGILTWSINVSTLIQYIFTLEFNSDVEQAEKKASNV